MGLFHRAREEDSEAMKELMRVDPEFAQFMPEGATTRNAVGGEAQRSLIFILAM